MKYDVVVTHANSGVEFKRATVEAVDEGDARTLALGQFDLTEDALEAKDLSITITEVSDPVAAARSEAEQAQDSTVSQETVESLNAQLQDAADMTASAGWQRMYGRITKEIGTIKESLETCAKGEIDDKRGTIKGLRQVIALVRGPVIDAQKMRDAAPLYAGEVLDAKFDERTGVVTVSAPKPKAEKKASKPAKKGAKAK